MTAKLLAAFDHLLWGAAVALALLWVFINLRPWTAGGPQQYDFTVYYLSGATIQAAPQLLYQPGAAMAATGLALNPAGPLLYPPTFAFLFMPLSRLPYGQAGMLWTMSNLAVITLVFWLLTRVWHDRRAGIMGALLWLLLPATLDNISLGNINLVLALLVTIAAFTYGRTYQLDILSGLTLGLAAAVKPFLLGPVLAGIRTRRWVFVITAVLSAALSAVLVYPWYAAAYGAYWRTLAYLLTEFSPPGQEFTQNQSIFAAFQKLAFRGTINLSLGGREPIELTFTPVLDPFAARFYALAAAASIVAGVVWALWRLDLQRPDASLAAWGLVLTAMLLLSPVSWLLYTTIIAPVYPALMVVRRQLSPTWRLLLPIGYIAILVERAYALWLPYAPWLPLTSAVLLSIFAWWLIFVRFAVRQQGQTAYRAALS